MSEIRSEDIKPSPTGDGNIALNNVAFAWFDPVTKERISKNDNEKKSEDVDEKKSEGVKEKKSEGVKEDAKAKIQDKEAENEAKIFFSMKDVSLNVKKGSIVAVVGPVASGKSCLLNAFLGEVFFSQGHLERSGTVSYASQTSCKLPGSLAIFHCFLVSSRATCIS